MKVDNFAKHSDAMQKKFFHAHCVCGRRNIHAELPLRAMRMQFILDSWKRRKTQTSEGRVSLCILHKRGAIKEKRNDMRHWAETHTYITLEIWPQQITTAQSAWTLKQDVYSPNTEDTHEATLDHIWNRSAVYHLCCFYPLIQYSNY